MPRGLRETLPPSDDQDIHVPLPIEVLNSPRNLLPGPFPLNPRGIEEDVNIFEPPRENMEHVSDHSPRGRGDDSNPLRNHGNRLLVIRAKSPSFSSFSFNCKKGKLKGPDSLRLHRFQDELIVASFFIETHPPRAIT